MKAGKPRASRAKPAKARKVQPSSQGEWLASMARGKAQILRRDDPAGWEFYVDCWRAFHGVQSAHSEVSKFLETYATSKACLERNLASLGSRFLAIENAILEPLSMALGTPDDLWNEAWPDLSPGDPAPTQLDFDLRLARWLRQAILQKDSGALRQLATALDLMPWLRIGITPDEVLTRILTDRPAEVGVDRSRLETVVRAFWEFIWECKRLPTKAELRVRAGLICETHKTNFSSYLKRLGFSGLPSATKGKLVRSRQG